MFLMPLATVAAGVDGFSWGDIVIFAGSSVTVATAIKFVFLPLVKGTRELWAWFQKFQRDWDGTPEEPGRDAVPGVMERLNQIDGEFKRNGGTTLKDQVVKTRESIDKLSERVTTMELRQNDIQRTQEYFLERIDTTRVQPRTTPVDSEHDRDPGQTATRPQGNKRSPGRPSSAA